MDSPAAKRRHIESKSDGTCTICLSALRVELNSPATGGKGVVLDATSVLRCGHVFHAACVEPWLERHATCPVCRNFERPPIKVTVRGIVIKVEWARRDLEAWSAVAQAIGLFEQQFPHFSFRFPMARLDSIKAYYRPSHESLGRRKLNFPVPINVDALATDIDGSPLIEIPAEGARHPECIEGEAFQYARLLLKQPEKEEWRHPRGIDPYYRRRPDWVAAMHEAHRTGQCGWSRKRRVLQLEAELAHDEFDEDGLYADDHAWAARRAEHVRLRQALMAYNDDEGGMSSLFHDEEGPLDGPIGRTHVGLPPSREDEAERRSIHRDALADLPLQFYGCPTRLECDGALEFVRHTMVSAGVLPRAEMISASQALRPISCTIHTEIVERSDDGPSGTSGGLTLECLARKVVDDWDGFATRLDKPLIWANIPGEGMLIVLNDRASAARGKLPTLTHTERIIPLPGANLVVHQDDDAYDEVDDG